ncbi:hypothetical protein U1839_12110 [Sphingomonas sp. RT2P30]|uniref:hypothetical protein n=1 Tax=Parasphingomonas halimpatiens TaxID=3096162 RepID=UPI002FC9CFB4
MRIAAVALLALVALGAAPAAASTYFPAEKTCPVGGEKFKVMALASISTFGALPDGMPIGSGMFPIALFQCPGNGLVMYRDFDAATVRRLAPIVAGAEYQVLRRTETPYYLAYRLALALGDAEPEWLLLSATWQAKNNNDLVMARRYGEEFVARVAAMPVLATSFTSIALRARAANALRELGRFKDAEILRASIVIAADAGGTDEDASDNRKGWGEYLASLAAPIARGDAARDPIDMAAPREAGFRCVAPLRKKNPGPPLSAFEAAYCARPEMASQLADLRRQIGDMLVAP